MDYKLYNINGKKTSSTIKLEKKVFGIEPHENSIYLAVKSEMAASRQGTSSTKTRGEVRGGGAKPYRQKGTGRARVGSTRNPARVHGGVAFGPKPHKYNLKVNKKVKKLARKSVLSEKLSSESLLILDDFSVKSNKTKDFLHILKNFKLDNSKVTVLINKVNEDAILGSRNIKDVLLLEASSASTYDLIDCKYLLLDKESAEYFNKHLK
tara:strand:- start:1360 stop:1986 length:627 start_codon:yes stop_codon:yes gene_type:complete